MVDELGKPPTDGRVTMARRLVDETGITEAQARELVSFLGLELGLLGSRGAAVEEALAATSARSIPATLRQRPRCR